MGLSLGIRRLPCPTRRYLSHLRGCRIVFFRQRSPRVRGTLHGIPFDMRTEGIPRWIKEPSGTEQECSTPLDVAV